MKVVPLQDSTRKRMRSADFHCRVKDVHQSTERIERLVSALGGVVEESTQRNIYHAAKTLQYKTDSVKRVQLYTATSDLKLRVPVAQLDSVVYTLSVIADFIDTRTLRDTDATLSYYANQLGNQDVKQLGPTRNDKAIDMNAVAQNDQQERINRIIANKQIDENVAYSTLAVSLFQPEVADIQILADEDALTRAGFGESLWQSLLSGLRVFCNILVYLVAIWPLWVLLLAGYWLYRSRLRKWFAGAK
ncbi:DUF4349 domain-containing protein [Chitinophaga sedimenti]|uniref:DUF4349 domain-containing protein n=1 Tax=Chitinophaga sedimenti TaxID=2033606 RepID=UPI00200634A0|nr:DUF4349 domain-containing protein [Chitinophaga sedimenti]MCK7554317.1 DUF4349 domain-containing protein [Chitinophaga sedimenti]